MKIEKGIAKNMELVGYHDLESKPGFQMAMQVVDGKWYLYLGHFWHGGWTILDVTEPSGPKFIKFVSGPSGTETIKVQVADGIMITSLQKWIALPGRPTDAPFEEGIYIWDVKDPVNPVRLGHWKTGSTGTHRNYYNGGRYVHLSAATRGFSGNIYRIVDIADPFHPVEVGRWWFPDQWSAGGAKVTKPVFGLHGPPYPKGDRVYLSYADAGMVILDISDITLPNLISRLEVYPPLGSPIACHTVLPLPRRDLAILSSEGVGRDAAERLLGVKKAALPLNFAGIVDVSDEKNPTLISIFPVPEPPPSSSFKNFHEKGGWFGPHNWHEPHNHSDLEDRDDRVYLTYFNAGVRVYDISDPYLPKEIAFYIPPNPKKRLGLPYGDLAVSSEDILVDKRGYVYVTDRNLGLHILRCTV